MESSADPISRRVNIDSKSASTASAHIVTSNSQETVQELGIRMKSKLSLFMTMTTELKLDMADIRKTFITMTDKEDEHLMVLQALYQQFGVQVPCKEKDDSNLGVLSMDETGSS